MDELMACMEDLVQETELSYPELHTAVDKYGKELIINFTELKYNKKCNGARVFKYLFKLSDIATNPWKDTDMNKDIKGRIVILTDLGIHKLRLLTNNPRKIAGLSGYGLHVENRIPLVICPSDHNAAYLAVKRDKLGHLLGAIPQIRSLSIKQDDEECYPMDEIHYF